MTASSIQTCKVHFKSENKDFEAHCGQTILDLAVQHKLDIRNDCGGLGLCGKCRITAEPNQNMSALSPIEIDTLTPRQITQANRLACQARIKGPLTVDTRPSATGNGELVLEKTIAAMEFRLNPSVRRVVMKNENIVASGHQRLSGLTEWVRQQTGQANCSSIALDDINLLRDLSMPDRDNADLTFVVHAKKGVTAILPGCHQKSYGVALDVGTTTLAAYLVDLDKGRVCASSSVVNPQQRFGLDVISRISYVDKNRKHLIVLQDVVVKAANLLIRRCIDSADTDKQNIDEVVVVGNTTMQHIFTGLHPHALGRSPFQPVVSGPLLCNASEIGLDLNPSTCVHLSPVISGFLGGDVLAAVIAAEAYKRQETYLIVDLGTNGELVLGNQKGLWATSCATGPALEGAHISCGMRASQGAVHQVRIDPETLHVSSEVFGSNNGVCALGICGSGIIDSVAAMLEARIILPDGRFDAHCPKVMRDPAGIGRGFVIVGQEKSATGEDIVITLKDIRQVQLAKAALATGIRMLFKKAGIRKADHTIVTGAFGAHFNSANAVTIGMLPDDVDLGTISSADNLAGVGAIAALCDHKKREDAVRLASEINHLDLAGEKNFSENFVQAASFPNRKD